MGAFPERETMGDISETVSEAVENAQERSDHLNSVIAVLVAVIATFMALCNVKDGNIVQAMAQAQAKNVDAWSYYQAKSTKQNLAESVLDQLLLEREAGMAASPAAKALLEQKIAAYQKNVRRYESEKDEIKKQAEGYQAEYDRLNVHDDQFDMSEAGLSLAIALLGVSALTKKKALVVVACVFAAFGIVLGLAGFFQWGFHPDALARFLS
jgi:chromosome segregation ATPase